MYIKPLNLLPGALSKPTPVPVNQPGSLISGKVMKWLGGQMATVNIGGQLYTAKVDGNLNAGDRYVFQVMTGDDSSALHLKLVASNENPKTPLSNQLFKQLGLASNVRNHDLLNYMIQKGVPLSPSTVKEWLALTESVPQMKDALAILDEMLARELPLNPVIFQAIGAVKRGPGATFLLEKLEDLLQSYTNSSGSEKSPELNAIKQLITEFLQQGESAQSPFSSGAALSQLFEKMGLFHEAMIGQFLPHSGGNEDPALPPQTLKGELITLLGLGDKLPNGLTQTASHLLHHITGEQLLSLTHDPNWFSLNAQIPIQLPNEKKTEAKVKWEIKKAPDGSLDPAFCRLLFHVYLTNLKETILQMVIQDRYVSCTLYTEGKMSIDPLASTIYDDMKQRLQELSFNLVGFHHRKESLHEIKKQFVSRASQMDVTI